MAKKDALNTRKSERIEKQTTPDPSPVKKKPEKIEKQTGPSPLRRSDRGKKSVEVPDLSNIKSHKDKTANSPKPSARDADEDKKNGRQDQNVAGRKRKSLNALRYKSLFIPQRIQIESDKEKDSTEKDNSPQDVDKELKSENNIRVQEPHEKGYTTYLEGNLMDLDQIEHGCPQTKPLDEEKQIDGNLSPSNINIADGNNHIFDTSSTRINHDVENQQELDPCDKVPESCKAAGLTENAENNANVQNSGNILNTSKFEEFWAPVQLSNVQIEQYCFTLLSNAMTLRFSSKNDTVDALQGILNSIRKCCNHPYLEDLALQNKIKKGPEPDKVIEAGTKASGKLQLLDRILCESKKRQLRVLILYQPTTGTSCASVPLAEILVDYVHMRFGEDSYECVVSGINPSKKQAALNSFNKDMSRFIFFLEIRACNPSIKFLSTDIVIIYDSDLHPANDLRLLQKISVHSQAEQIMILRLYSKSTLEEKLVQLSEQNPAVDSRSKSRYQALLMWGASEQFDKLSEFLSQDVHNISSDESLLNDVMKEFLYLISNKYKSEDTYNSIITRVGNYGKRILLNSEIKTHLPDGDQPHLFWKTLLERPYPNWKFVSVSTPQQRKRPSYFRSVVEDGGARTRRKTVNNTIEPAQLKPVTDGETEGVNEEVRAHNESHSSSGNETSLHDLLKPTVSELFKVLKLSKDVKIIVDTFLEFVLKNYNVSKEHTSTLQAFMISLCWIGSSLAKFKIDRSESFKLAKNHCNFTCKEAEANEVYSKLNSAKEAFLEDTEIQDALKDYIPELKGVKPDNEISQPSENVVVSENHESSNEDVSRKKQEEIEIEYFNREWDMKRVNLENDKQTEESLIRVLYIYPSIIRSEKLKILDQKFATKLEEHERMREILIKALKERQLAANNKVSLHGPEHETRVEAQNIPEVGPTLSANPKEAETHVDIESTGSHTSEKQMADAMMSSEPIVKVPAQQCDDVEDDVADKVDSVEVGTIDSNQENVTLAVEEGNETGVNDVTPHVEFGEMGMPAGNCNKNFAEDCTICPDTSHEAEDCDLTGPYDDDTIRPHVEFGETGMPDDNSNKGISDNGTIFLDTSHAVEDRHETSPDDVAPLVVSGETGMPASDCEKENGEDSIISPDSSQAVEELHLTGPVDMALHTDSAEMEMLAGDSNKENAEDSFICPDTSPVVQDHNETGPNDVEPHVDYAEMATPAGNSNEENCDVSIISPDASHGGEDHNDSCDSSSNSPSANVSQDKAPSVHPVASPTSDHSVPIIPEIQNESLQQLADIVMQDNEDEAVAISLPELNINNPQGLNASQHSQITPEEPLSTTDPASGILLETTSEDPGLAVETPHQPLLASSDAPAPLITAEIPNQNSTQPDVNMVDVHGFDNHNQVGPQILNHTDPLQAEVERLYAMKDNVPKFLEETKQRLNSEREKEIAEIMAQINLKYEVKNREAEITWHLRKKDIETNLNKVAMNKVLAEAFRSKCQDLIPGHLGISLVSQAGLMQQLHRSAVQRSMRGFHSAASSSSAEQSSGSQQTTPPPPQPPPSSSPPSPPPQPQTRRQPPLQIVHQPSALFSTTPSRSQPPNTTVRPPPNTTVRPPSTTPITQPPSINQITSSSTLSRAPPSTNQTASSSMQNRLLASNRPMDMSAANLRVNTETRNQTSHFRPSVNSETRAPAPHMRPLASSEQRVPAPLMRPLANSEHVPAPLMRSLAISEQRALAPLMRSLAISEQRALAPHILPPVSSEIRAPAPHMRPLPSSNMRAPAPHIRPFRSTASVSPAIETHRRILPSQQITSSPSSLTSPSNFQSPVLPPISTSSPQPLPPLPSEPYTVPSPPPPPPPPSSEPDTVLPPLPSEPYIVPSPPPPETYTVPSPPPPPPAATTSAAQTPPSSVLPQQHPPSSLLVTSSSQTQPSKPASVIMNNTPRWVDVPTPPSRSTINLVVVDAPTPPLSSHINLVDLSGSSSPDLVCLSDDD